MNLKQTFLAIWKWWWLLLLSTGLAAFFSWLATVTLQPSYTAKTALMVGQVINTQNPTNTDIETPTRLAQTYLQFVRRQLILQAVIETLGLPMRWEQLAQQINASIIGGTQLFEISVIDSDPQRAKAIADEIARQLIALSPSSEKDIAQIRLNTIKQLNDLQINIDQGKAEIEKLERQLPNETSARVINDINTRIAAKQTQITAAQTNYAQLLNFLGGGTNVLRVVEPATVPTTPISSQRTQTILLGALVGLVLSIAGALLLEYLDDTVKNSDDVRRIAELPTLGTVFRMTNVNQPSDRLVSISQPKSPIAESYRALRANLQFSGFKQSSSALIVTSATPGEGKTTTSANLAIIMAQGNKRVILVDADLHRPTLHKIFGVPNKVGFTSLVLDEALTLDEALQQTDLPNLRLLTCGPLPPSPADFLNSEEVAAIIERLRQSADLVIFDTPPVLAVTDAIILAARLQSTIIVIDSGRTRSDMVRSEVEKLQSGGAKIIGVVLNKLDEKNIAGGSYYYYAYTSSRSQPGFFKRLWPFKRAQPAKRRRMATETVATSEAH